MGYKATDTEGVTRTYIIEKAEPANPEVPLPFNWIAIKQDTEGWSDRRDRMIYYGQTIGEVVTYLSMHYPGSMCVGIWPIGATDDDPLTRMVLEALGLGGA